ncbi:MAG: N-acetylmuramoyl-L-alanine amidase [Gammaproteobacteria bacterium HGW-Gammaproteobacteria-4]|nr:MAG: N-acetylmuramoyl-L-alanine amidase [Gammaproteobacteria bacterium HGW-Gammaproteobacteria-4]
MPIELPPSANPLIEPWPLPWEDRLEQRPLRAIDLVVIHCTELPDLTTARAYGERVLYESGTGNSGHYYIDRDGRVLRFIAPERATHHTRGYNARSIGIELINAGRYPDWLDSRHQAMSEPYTEAQITALIALLRTLHAQIPSLRGIAGHEDLDRDRVPASDDPGVLVYRKRDPGPLFPWDTVIEGSGIARYSPEKDR